MLKNLNFSDINGATIKNVKVVDFLMNFGAHYCGIVLQFGFWLNFRPNSLRLSIDYLRYPLF